MIPESMVLNISVWFLLQCPPLGTWPATRACALTGSRTSNPSVYSSMFSPLEEGRSNSPIPNKMWSFQVSHSFPKVIDSTTWWILDVHQVIVPLLKQESTSHSPKVFWLYLTWFPDELKSSGVLEVHSINITTFHMHISNNTETNMASG